VTSILDTMRAIQAPVSTVAFGIVGSTAAAVLASGAKGRRFSMQNTRILLQQPMGGLQGSAGARKKRAGAVVDWGGQWGYRSYKV
jgi:ATP-dependent Clp protease protease subunit